MSDPARELLSRALAYLPGTLGVTRDIRTFLKASEHQSATYRDGIEDAAKVAEELWVGNRPIGPKHTEIAAAIRSLVVKTGSESG